jgi:hypothetical protein
MNENDLRVKLHHAAEDIPVPALPLETQPRKSATPRRFVVLAAAAAVAVVAAGSFTAGTLLADEPPATVSPAGTGPDGATSAAAEQLRRQLEELPGIPFALPTALPDGYQWHGTDSFLAEPDGGPVVMRSVVFTLDEGEGTAHVCAAATDRAAQACPISPSAEPIRRTLPDHTLVLIGLTAKAAGDRSFWESVDLTDDVEQPWLAEDSAS